jgi:hypothetical protein
MMTHFFLEIKAVGEQGFALRKAFRFQFKKQVVLRRSKKAKRWQDGIRIFFQSK